MKLAEYLKTYGHRKKEFAAAIGVSATTLSYWLSKKRIPNRKHALRIREKTGGKVGFSDWYDE